MQMSQLLGVAASSESAPEWNSGNTASARRAPRSPSPKGRGSGACPLHGYKSVIHRECRICTLKPSLAQTPSRTKPRVCTRAPMHTEQESCRGGSHRGASLTQTAPKPLCESGNHYKMTFGFEWTYQSRGHSSSIILFDSHSHILKQTEQNLSSLKTPFPGEDTTFWPVAAT